MVDIEKEKRIDRNATIGLAAAAVMIIGAAAYTNPHQQVKNSYYDINGTISTIEREFNADKPLPPFDDPIITENFLRAMPKYPDDQRKSLETAIGRAYQIREEIINSPEYAEYEDIESNRRPVLYGGMLLILGTMGYFVTALSRFSGESKKLKKSEV